MPTAEPTRPQEPPVGTAVGGATAEVYGLLRLDTAEIALPLAALREVVPRPAGFESLPLKADGLLGAMRLRNLVVPVVDLRPRLGLQAGVAERQVVVVVAAEGQVVGVIADEVRGIVPVPERDMLELHGGATPGLFSRTFRRPESDDVVSVLDEAALIRTPDVPTARVPAAAPSGQAPGRNAVATTSAAPRKLTLVQCGAYVLGLDSEHVRMLVPPFGPRPSVLQSSLCLGVTDYSEREVAVVDPLVLLGLGALPSGAVGGGLVLDVGTGYVVLALTSLLDLVEVPASQVLPVPGFAVQRRELVSGILARPGEEQVVVLAGTALARETDLRALAGLNTLLADVESDRGGSSDAARAAASLSSRRYLSYSAGTRVLTRLEQVAEIVPLPEALTDTGGHPAVLGVTVHRDAAVPVLCLATLLGLGSTVSDRSCALLVQDEEGTVAFVVDALHAIEPLSWEDPDPPRARGPVVTPADLLQRGPLVKVGDSEQLLHELDLQALGRLLRGPAVHDDLSAWEDEVAHSS